MSDNSTTSTALSTEVNNPLCGLTLLLEAACFDQMMSCLFPCGRPLTNQERRKVIFAATDRSKSNKTYDYDLAHDVLELVLSQNHCVGGRISDGGRMSIVIEMPDQRQLIPGRPPLPKGNLQQIQDSLRDLVNLLSLNPTPIPDEQRDRWEPAEQRTFELVLNHCGPIRSQQISNQVSVFVRRASLEEIVPYHVDFHLSQKAWHERMMIWMSQSSKTCKEKAATAQAVYIPRCTEIQEWQDYDDFRMVSDDSMVEAKSNKQIPGEIAVKSTSEETSNSAGHNENESLESSTPQKNVWIPDFDVVLGAQTKTTTTATKIFEERVLPVYSSKTHLRESHIKIIKLMLQEELRDEAKMIEDDTVPESTFWVKMSEVQEEPGNQEGKSSRNSDCKWLCLENGDFVGPFVVASNGALQRAVAAGNNRDFQPDLQPSLCGGQIDPEPSFSALEAAPTDRQRDPEPSFCALETSPTDEQEDPPIEDVRQALSKGSMSPAKPAEHPPLFNLTGPLQNLSEEAKQTCQEWVDNSDTLLIKAAKKTMIDAFQADFHSFLFLFQVQLNRIKGGDLRSSCGSKDGFADDCSWVSAEPSVQEEDTRVEDIEQACIAFMNHLGNSMVRHYARLAGDPFVNASAPIVPLFSEDQRDDQVGGAEEIPNTASTTLSPIAIENKASIEARQSIPTSVSELGAEVQQQHRKDRYQFYPQGNAVIDDLAVVSKQEGPEKSVVENAKSVSFDLHESGNKLKAAIMQLETQRHRGTPTQKKASTRKKDGYNLNFNDDDEAEESSRKDPSSESSSFDTFEPSLEASFESRTERYYDSPCTRSRSRSRTFSTEYCDDDDTFPTFDSLHSEDDDDTFPTFDSPRNDDDDDDDTFPTFDSPRNDSVTLSPSEMSDFEEFCERNKPKSSWLPEWLLYPAALQ